MAKDTLTGKTGGSNRRNLVILGALAVVIIGMAVVLVLNETGLLPQPRTQAPPPPPGKHSVPDIRVVRANAENTRCRHAPAHAA